MAERVEITDQDSAHAWLETQEPQTQIWFASRCALRALPAIGRWRDVTTSNLDLATCRALLVASAASTCSKAALNELGPAAADASAVADRSARSAAPRPRSASNSAARAAAAADSAAYAVVAANSFATGRLNASTAARGFHVAARCIAAAMGVARPDAAARSSPAESSTAHAATTDANASGNWNTLWPAREQPEALNEDWRALKTQWQADDADWSFWIEWYERILVGTPMDWDLVFRIATEITDDEWDAGQARVAVRIEEIRAEWLLTRLPQFNEVYETDDGQYEVRGAIRDTTKLMQSVLSRVTFALDTAVQSNMCDLNEMSLACKILRQALLVGADDANMVEQYFRRASALIISGIKSGKYAEDDETHFLIDVLDETALQLRGDHPEVAEAVATRLKTRLLEIDAEKRVKTAELIENLREGTGPRLNAELGLAAEVTRDASSVEASADAVKESGNIAGKIRVLERAKTAESSGSMALAKMAVRSNQLAEWVTSLISGAP